MSEFRFQMAPGALGRLMSQVPQLIDKGNEAGVSLAVHAAEGNLAGTFTGKISGTFQINSREAVVVVTAKPFLATDGMIRSKLGALFS